MIDDSSPWMAEYVTLYRKAMSQAPDGIVLLDAEELDAHLEELRRLRALAPDAPPEQLLSQLLSFLSIRRQQRVVPSPRAVPHGGST
jgi:hypothetical protein